MAKIIKPVRRLYIAYASNINKRQMARRCPDAEPKYSMIMDDARLVFRSVADLVYEPGSKAAGVLWSISERDEKELDRFEGFISAGNPHNNYEKLFVTGGVLGKKQAIIYLKQNDDGVYPPSAIYADVIRRGFLQWKLDESFLDQAIIHSFDEKNPSADTERRRKRRHKHSDPYERRIVRMPESVALKRLDLQRQAWEQAANEQAEAETANVIQLPDLSQEEESNASAA